MSVAPPPVPGPQDALYGGERMLPALPPCVLYSGSEKLIRKGLALQAERGPVFDVAADCEDGAPIGAEHAHAAMVAAVIAGTDNRHRRAGARVHDVRHPAFDDDLETLVGGAGEALAFLTLPKVESVDDVRRMLDRMETLRARCGLARRIPVSVMIETPGAVHDAWAIAALPDIVSLDFGTLDFVSAHHGAIPAGAMDSPGQFENLLVRRAKAATVEAALAHAVVPTHGVTRALDDPDVVYADARRSRDEFGFLRMWAIHPSQVEPIVAAMRPDSLDIQEAASVLHAARGARWAPLRIAGRLHDRASYRYCWFLLQRARAGGATLPEEAAGLFDDRPASA
jgi:citrate lyase subunit beta / citryl-CoA lyase